METEDARALVGAIVDINNNLRDIVFEMQMAKRDREAQAQQQKDSLEAIRFEISVGRG